MIEKKKKKIISSIDSILKIEISTINTHFSYTAIQKYFVIYFSILFLCKVWSLCVYLLIYPENMHHIKAFLTTKSIFNFLSIRKEKKIIWKSTSQSLIFFFFFFQAVPFHCIKEFYWCALPAHLITIVESTMCCNMWEK